MEELIQFIKAHALKHYADGGWDVVVECWEDAEIGAWLAESNATTEDQALASFAPLIDVWSDRQADAINSQF